MPSGLVIVTGGSRGIGAAICRRLAAAGHAIAVNYTADAKAAETTVEEIKNSGGRGEAFQADVADLPSFLGCSTRRRKRLGRSPASSTTRAPREPFRHDRPAGRGGADASLSINVIGTILACKEAVLRLSTKHGGSGGAIVNISSIAARIGGLPGLASLCSD